MAERLKKLKAVKFKLPARLKKKKAGKNSKFVLSIGDDGAILAHMKDKRVVARHYIPNLNSPDLKIFKDMLATSPKSPVAVFFDTLDQTYVQQTLPPISPLSVDKLIRRRLEREFSGDYIKGAIKYGRGKSGRKDWNFLMAALQRSTLIESWVVEIKEWPNRIQGFYMLPLEMSQLTVRIAQSMCRKATVKASPWQFVVSYNKISGLRQVIYREGQLMLTRLAQPSAEQNAAAVAGSIEHEIVGTMEYMRRIAGQEQPVADVVIIASPDLKPLIDNTHIKAANVFVMTPYEAALELGSDSYVQEPDRFADIMLSTAIATINKPRLKLSVDGIDSQNKYYFGIHISRAALVLSGVYLACYLIYTAWSMFSLYEDIGDLEVRRKTADVQMMELRKKAADAPEDLEKIADTVDSYDALSKKTIAPSYVLAIVSNTLSDTARATQIDWVLFESAPVVTPPGKAPPPPKKDDRTMEVDIMLDFNVSANVTAKVVEQETKDLLNKFKAAFPDHEVRYGSLTGIAGDNEKLDINLGEASPPLATIGKQDKPVQARLVIKGPLILSKTPDTPATPAPTPPKGPGHEAK